MCYISLKTLRMCIFPLNTCILYVKKEELDGVPVLVVDSGTV